MKKLIAITLMVCFALGNARAQQRVGINITSPIEPLDVNGNINLRGLIKINGNPGANNQVMMSQGPGTDPVWANSAYSGGGRFWTTIASSSRSTGSVQGRGDNWSLNSGTSQEDSVDFGTATVFGSDITITNQGLLNNYININKTGLYHFEGTMRIFTTCDDAVTMSPRAVFRIKANRPFGADIDVYLIEDLMERTGSPATGQLTNQFNYFAKFRIDIHLEANTTVAFLAGFNLLKVSPPLIALGYSTGGYISGHFISE